MSTELFDNGYVSLTQFAGGSDRGVCVQITTTERPTSHVSLNVREARELVGALSAWLRTRGEL